jgi:hypothetical protein
VDAAKAAVAHHQHLVTRRAVGNASHQAAEIVFDDAFSPSGRALQRRSSRDRGVAEDQIGVAKTGAAARPSSPELHGIRARLEDRQDAALPTLLRKPARSSQSLSGGGQNRRIRTTPPAVPQVPDAA